MGERFVVAQGLFSLHNSWVSADPWIVRKKKKKKALREAKKVNVKPVEI